MGESLTTNDVVWYAPISFGVLSPSHDPLNGPDDSMRLDGGALRG